MQRLRATAFLARFVLAWFALSLTAAMASPLFQPNGLQLICGAGAVKLLDTDGGGAPAKTLTLDCALCSPAVVPPPAQVHARLPALRHEAPKEAAPPPVLARAVPVPSARGPPAGQPG